MNKKSPDPIDVAIGARVRARRMMLQMSQTILAETIGVTFQQVQKYEKGTNRIGGSRMQKVADALGCPAAAGREAGAVPKPASGHLHDRRRGGFSLFAERRLDERATSACEAGATPALRSTRSLVIGRSFPPRPWQRAGVVRQTDAGPF